MNTLVIEKQTGGYFKFTLNGDTANAITSIQNDLLAVGTQLHFKTGNGANIIKEQFIYPADVTIIASGTFTFTTVAQVWDKLIDIDYFAWLGGGGTGGVDRFDDLLDTFSYTGNAGKAVVVDGSELRLVPITLYNKRLFTELEDTPSSLVPNKMLVVNPAGTAVVLQDQPEQPEQLLNSVGYFDYNDLITQTTPLNAVANVALKLTNDTEGANTSTDQNPYGVSYVWDYTTNAFNFSELEVGDTIDVRIHVQVTTTSANQRVLLSAKFGIGSVAEFTNIIYENQFKSAGLHEINFVAPFYMGSTYITDNPAELYLTTDSSATVKVDGWYVRILRKNINIITVDYTVPDATTTVKGIVRLAGDLAGTANSPTVPELANKVPNTRTVSTTSPLLGGGALSSNLTLSIQQANSVDSGYLSNVDWSTFNAKANDNAVVKLTGDQTISGVKTFSNPTIFNSSLNIASGAYSILYNPANSAYWQTYVDSSNVFNFGYNGNIVKASISNSGNFTANSFIKSGGTSSQFLKADGSVDSTTYANDNAVVKLTGDQSITGSKSFTTNTAAPAMIVTNNSTDNGILLQNTSTGRGITSNNVSTGIGIRSDNTGGGTGISSSNTGAGTGIVSTNTSTTGSALSISNSSTGYGILLTNSTGTGISSSNTGSGTGFYSNNSSTGNGIQSINSSSGYGISSSNTGSGRGIYSSNNSTGDAINISNSGSGRGIYLTNASTGNSMILNNTTAATGMPFTIQKNGTDVFTINDAGEATGVKFIKSGGTSSQFLKADGSIDSTTYQTALTNPVTGTGTTNYIPKFTGSSAIGNSQIYDNGTNVGIGIESQSDAKLYVQGALNIPAARFLRQASFGTVLEIGRQGYSFGASFGYPDDNNLSINTNSNERIRIFANGNTFIGASATDAGYKLDVNGTGRFSGTVTGISYGINRDSVFRGGLYSYKDIAGGGTDYGLTLFAESGSGNGNIYFCPAGSSTKAATLTTNGELLIGRTSSYGAGWQLAVEGNIYAKNDLRIDANASFGGNVGIGTTSPSGKLEVSGSYAQFNGGGIDGTLGEAILFGNTTYPNNQKNRIRSSISASNTGNLLVFETGNGTTGSYNSNQLVLRGDGNVGIGTPSPSVKLQVESSTVAAFIKSSGNPVPISIFNSSSTVSTIGFKGSTTANEYNVRVGADAENFVAYTSDTERMRITSGGNVEIKNSDSRLLGGNTSGRFIVSNSDTSAYVSINGSANGTPNNIALITNSQITFNTGASYSESMRITSGGNVGIRTTSPESGWNVDIAGIVAMGSTAGNGRLYVSCANTTNGITYIQARNLSVATPMSYLASSHTFDTNVTAPGFFNSSDIRLKEIVDYDYNVLDIKPITYLWKDGRDNKKHVGYSAQEVQKVMPDAVNEGTDGMLSVNYVEILVAKISQMEKEIELLKSKL